MSQQVQEVDPLEISFSNDKGFEPSTPSQGSPPPQPPKQSVKLHIKTPIELWENDKKNYMSQKTVTPFRVQTPPSKTMTRVTQSLKKYDEVVKDSYLRRYQTRFSSVPKKTLADSLLRDSLLHGSPYNFKSITSQRQIFREPVQDKKKKSNIARWNGVDTVSHLKQISRLNDLINRVSSHVTVYGRLYPQKRK